MLFKIGDRVECISGRWYDDTEGMKGIIVKIRDYERKNYGIKFDEPVRRERGHDLDGFLSEEESSYGYYIREDDLKLCKKSNIGDY